MHMADALVAPVVAGTMYACSAAAAGYSIKKIKETDEIKKVPVMGVMGAFVFAAQMINFTIPGTGSSGHLCGGMLISAIIGPYAGFITMVGVLLIQCLLFADGGLLALGCNVWNMAFYGCFIGSLFIWKWVMRNGMNKKKIVAASVLGCVLTLQLGAFSVVLETTASKITELPFLTFAAVMQPIHLVIGLIEGVITAFVLSFVYEARPELLWRGNNDELHTEKEGRLTYRKTIGVIAVLALFVAGVLSLYASAFPDGLEWSIAKITGSTEIEKNGAIYGLAAKMQEAAALFPNYSFRASDSAAGTSFSGMIGGIAVIVFCIAVGKVVRVLQKKKVKKNE